MILLKQGNVGPTVVALQVLLNRKLERGTAVEVDGHFGPKTRQAVIEFQALQRLESQTGDVWKETWARLTEGTGLTVLDAVDETMSGETKVKDIEAAGGRPVVTGGMYNGAEDALWRISRQAGRPGSLVLLRFQGHGKPGVMGVSIGTGGLQDAKKRPITRFQRGHLGADTLPFLERGLAALRPCFAHFGSVELMGCRTAGDISGRKLLVDLCAQLGVPVSAGVLKQLSQNPASLSTFKFEGPIVTAFPGGGTLRTWARGVARREAEHALCR
jgi:hypothetical protein